MEADTFRPQHKHEKQEMDITWTGSPCWVNASSPYQEAGVELVTTCVLVCVCVRVRVLPEKGRRKIFFAPPPQAALKLSDSRMSPVRYVLTL